MASGEVCGEADMNNISEPNSHCRLPDKESKLQFKEVHIYVVRFLR